MITNDGLRYLRWGVRSVKLPNMENAEAYKSV
jgi:hypothetical protein